MMENNKLSEVPPWENLNMKVRIGSLLFDIDLDRTFIPGKFGPGQSVNTSPKHTHAAYEVHFIISGSGNLFIEEDNERVRAGSIHIIGPNIFHTLRQDTHDTITRFTFRFVFEEQSQYDTWFPLMENDQIKDVLKNLTHYRIPEIPRKIVRMMDEIRNEISRPSLGTYTTVQSLMMYTLIYIIRSLPRKESAYNLSFKAKDDQRTQIVDEFFSRRYNEEITVQILAEKLNLSVKQINRLLQKQYGLTFKQKLIETRIEVAKILLRSSNLSIEQIAEHVHYSTPYFSHIFNEKLSMPPSQYRILFTHQIRST